MADEFDNPQKLVKDILDTYTTDQNVNYEELMHLLLRWGSLTLHIVAPYRPEKLPPEIIQVENGWTIHDYGNRLVISRGEEWPLGHLTNGQMLNSIKRMVDVLSRQGVESVNAVGFPVAMRAAWIMLSDYGIKVPNFDPNPEDFRVRERVRAMMHKEPTLAPRPQPGG